MRPLIEKEQIKMLPNVIVQTYSNNFNHYPTDIVDGKQYIMLSVIYGEYGYDD